MPPLEGPKWVHNRAKTRGPVVTQVAPANAKRLLDFALCRFRGKPIAVTPSCHTGAACRRHRGLLRVFAMAVCRAPGGAYPTIKCGVFGLSCLDVIFLPFEGGSSQFGGVETIENGRLHPIKVSLELQLWAADPYVPTIVSPRA